MSLERWLELQNRSMVAFDLALGSGALLAPRRTLAALGHEEPSFDAERLFQRFVGTAAHEESRPVPAE